jgi:alkanesulfonate monooxygenase SsuD/methylene tetrahydromethanopterin reductase-like flavin-dependent oxidoreductase (luciferase family)
MSLEYALQVAGPYQRLLDAVDLVKERGMVALALPDHYLMALTEEEAAKAEAPDALIQLGGLARETTDIELVVLVAPITFRHPAVLAKTAVTLDRMSGGRFTLGVGTGWMDREHEVFGIPYPDRKERFAMLEEALAYLYAAFDPDHPGYQGERYQLEDFPLSPMSDRRVPLLVGGTGEYKTPRLAGTYADEFNVYPGPNYAERIQRCKDAAVAAGRDPEAILISSAGQVIAKETEEEFETYLDEVAIERGMTRDELDAYFASRRPPQGTYEQVRNILDDYAEMGMQRFYFQGIYGNSDPRELLDALGIHQ